MRKAIVVVMLSLLMVVPLCAMDLPDTYFGAAFDSKVSLTTFGAADIFGKYGVALAAGAVESRGPMLGASFDVGSLVERIGLEYFLKVTTVIKVLGYGAYDTTEKNWSGGVAAAAISLSF